jgi:hypothetical protein
MLTKHQKPTNQTGVTFKLTLTIEGIKMTINCLFRRVNFLAGKGK